MDDKTLTITTDDGKKIECEILFTNYSEKFKKNYVVFQVKGTDRASAAIYVEESNNNGHLEEIKTEEEWNYLSELLDQYNNDDEPCKNCQGSCSGCETCESCEE